MWDRRPAGHMLTRQPNPRLMGLSSFYIRLMTSGLRYPHLSVPSTCQAANNEVKVTPQSNKGHVTPTRSWGGYHYLGFKLCKILRLDKSGGSAIRGVVLDNAPM